MTAKSTGDSEGSRGATVRVGVIDRRHLLLVGAGPGLGLAVAHRFASGGYRVTLVARSTDRLGELASSLADTGAEVNTIEADASDPGDFGARMTELYRRDGAPGVVIYNAVMGAPDRLLSSTVAHLQNAYAVDVIGAIVVAQSAAPAMRAAGFGTIIVTGGRIRRSPDPGARHRLPRRSRSSVGRDDARRRSAPRRHPSGNPHDRRTDRGRNFL
jgi:NADP-dependent 3-hydroxy acid dehydrogenase YdfG